MSVMVGNGRFRGSEKRQKRQIEYSSCKREAQGNQKDMKEINSVLAVNKTENVKEKVVVAARRSEIDEECTGCKQEVQGQRKDSKERQNKCSGHEREAKGQ